MALRIWGVFLYILNILIHWFECVSNLGDVEGYSLGGGVGAESCVCTLGRCETGSTLGAGAGVMMIFWC